MKEQETLEAIDVILLELDEMALKVQKLREQVLNLLVITPTEDKKQKLNNNMKSSSFSDSSSMYSQVERIKNKPNQLRKSVSFLPTAKPT